MKDKQLEETLELNIQYKEYPELKEFLVPVIVQDVKSREILMEAFANRNAIEETMKTRYATFYSRSRKQLWVKGKTSGDLLRLIEMRVDCDQDSVLYIVEKEGRGACHTKDQNGKTRNSCFYRKVNENLSLEFI